MKILFNCLETGDTFETDNFSLADNHGVAINIHGEKVLKATVVLNSPCPCCQGMHTYKAEDLACPFTST